jgi:hypothetical protein
MNPFFDIDGARLGQLNDVEAVGLIHQLLHSEASIIGGVDQSKIDVPVASDAVHTRDGGVDAEVLDATPDSRSHGIIKVGQTSYQIKTGSFKISGIANARKIIQAQNSDGTKIFKPRVETCLENNGTLVVVLFGSDQPDSTDQASITHLRNAIKEVDSTYSSAKIEIWKQNNLIAFLGYFPSIRLRWQKNPVNNLHSVDTWSRLGDMSFDMVTGDAQASIIDGIHDAVNSTQVEALRLLGDPGVGKTRTALEALKDERYKPLVIYATNPSAIPTGLLNRFLQTDNTEHVILVVDECDPVMRGQIWNNVKSVADRVKLITIYNVEEESPSDMVQLDAEPLSDDQIQQILTSSLYNIQPQDAQRLAVLCSGSPRVAHIIGADVARTGNVNINSHEDLWSRYIASTDSTGSIEYTNRLKVLKWIALFRRFGYDRPLNNEGDMIGKKIQQNESISDGDFRSIVSDLRRRKILQGDTTLYITPKLLHIWLWKLWWDEHGGSFDYDNFIKVDESTQFTQQLIDWFGDMLRYGKESVAVSKIVDDLLKSPFGDPSFLDSERGSRLIQILARVDQEAVLKFIETRLNAVTVEELRFFRNGRRGFVNALELISVTPQYFERSADALFKLAEAENETWANNATGTFAGLFSNAHGEVAPTAASPEQRFPVLERAIKVNTLEAQKVIVKAIDVGLEAVHFTRMSSDDGSGLIEKVKRWTPATYGEWWDAYRRVWQFAFNNLPVFADDYRKDLIHHMIIHLRGLISRLGIKDEIIGWIRDLINSDLIDNREILKEIVSILHYDKKNLPIEIVEKLEVIKDELTGSGYEALMRRYVGVNIFEDELGDDGKHSNAVTKKIESLAEESLEDPTKLEFMLPWLVTKDPDHSYSFGFQLGRLDVENNLLDLIINTQKNVNETDQDTQFLAGYLQSLRRRDEEKWESILDDFAKSTRLQKLVPEITWRSGMTDRSMYRIMGLSKSGVVDGSIFRMFGYGSVLEPLSVQVFEELIEYLLTNEYESIDSVILDYASFYYEMKKKATIPEDLGFRIITQPSLFISRAANKRSQMDDYYWGRVADEYISVYPHKAADLAQIIVAHFGEDGTIVDSYRDEASKILKMLIKLNPVSVWNIVSPRISKLKNGSDLQLMWWLNGGVSFGRDRDAGAMALFPPDLLWQWIDEDVENRAKIVASYIPKGLFNENEKICLARELLVRYGDRKDVRDSFSVNNGNDGWSGDASLHYINEKSGLVEFKKSEDDKNVIQWIDEYTAYLDKQIEQSRLEEERRDY